MIKEVLIPIFELLARVISYTVLASFVLGLLVAFNVVDARNRFVSALGQALNAILEPILRPIRRRMPDTGAIDFSPIVVLMLIQILLIILNFLGKQFE